MVRGLLLICLMAIGVIQGNGQTHQQYTVSSPEPLQRSWFEHVVPGITFQIQRNNRGVDINPWVGYQFTTRVTAGLGWNERMSAHYHHHLGVSRRRAVYGPRSFFDYQLGHGFSARVEVEALNAYTLKALPMRPPLFGAYPFGPDGTRQWEWGLFIGAKKTFRITGRWKGSLQLLYNIYHNVNSPYSDLLNFRFGFEFPLKKR